MTTFRYPPAYTRIDQSQKSDQLLYENLFADHAAWLALNEIEYGVVGFRWPEIITMLFSHARNNIAIEFDIMIEDEDQAVMFRLYTGLPSFL